MSTSRDSDSGPCVFSRYSGDPNLSDAVVAWSSFDSTYPFNSQVFFQQFTAFVGRSLSASGTACGDAPSISQIGTYAIGSPDFGVAMDAGSAAVAQSILLISVDGSLTPTCGNCTMLTTPIAFPTTMTSATTGEVGIPIPCDPALDGGTLWFQFANIGSPNGDCALVPVLSLSRRLSAALRD